MNFCVFQILCLFCYVRATVGSVSPRCYQIRGLFLFWFRVFLRTAYRFLYSSESSVSCCFRCSVSTSTSSNVWGMYMYRPHFVSPNSPRVFCSRLDFLFCILVVCVILRMHLVCSDSSVWLLFFLVSLCVSICDWSCAAMTFLSVCFLIFHFALVFCPGYVLAFSLLLRRCFDLSSALLSVLLCAILSACG